MTANPVKFGRENFVGLTHKSLRDNYECTKKLGKGGFGKVYQVKNKSNGKIYRNPLVEEKGTDRIDVGWETAEEYLSGDVVEKLAIAEAKAKENDMYLQNVRALREVQPVPLKASDIEVKLRCNMDTNILYRTICKRKI